MVSMNYKVSIVIPTFNEEEYLPKLLESIKKQTIKPFEIIVADAFSTDNTRSIAKLYKCKIVNGGLPAKARNEGAKVAKGNLLLFLDADVILPKNFLKNTLAEFSAKNLDIASCYMDPITKEKMEHMLFSLANFYFKFTKSFYPHIPGFCIFIKKHIHQKIKGFNEELFTAEDHDYVQRAEKFGKFAYLKTYKIPVSVRRMSKEGRVKLIVKYAIVELHMILLGNVKHSIFHYEYGQYKKPNNFL